MKFLHAADVHLDAQQRGLAVRDGAPVERFQRATRDAFSNLVSLALREAVDFVVIAGDLFDRDSADVRTWLWTVKELQRLEKADIPVYLIRGNHDFLGGGGQRLTWPANVHEFRGDQPETKTIDALGVALHGQSFPDRAVVEDLAAQYPDRIAACFNIGLLHTSLTGENRRHDTYAPTSPDVLKLRGYDYWALGHIHTFQQVAEEPAIVYPGCTQGRHVNEPGVKGCVVVTVRDRQPPEITFHPLDVVRWSQLTVEFEAEDDRNGVLRRVESALSALQDESGGRSIAVRVTLCGACGCHHWMSTEAGADELQAEIEAIAHALGDVWIERVVIRTRPVIDVAELRREQSLLGELLRDLASIASSLDEDLLTLAAPVLEPLTAKLRGELESTADGGLLQAELIRGWLEQSEGIIVDALGQEGAE